MARRVKVDLIGDASSLNKAFRSAGLHADKFGGSVHTARRVAGAAFAGIAAGAGALAAVGVASVKAASEYEDTMQKIVGLSGVAESAVKRFEHQVLALAPAVGKSPQELAEALYFITSSGIKASKAMAVLRVSAKASAAGLGDTQVVADAVTSAMNAYGPAMLGARQATDVLVATVREGKGEASSFAGVIGNVAAIAAQLGVRFDEVGAALAGETRLGIDAETSATQLNAFFSSLLKTTPKAEKALANVGLSSAGLRKELKERGLLATLQTLKDAFGDNTSAMAKAFPNVRALRGILALVGKQAGSTRGIFQRLAHSSGSLKVAFGAISGDASFRMRQLSATLKALSITIGLALLPLVNKYAHQLSVWISKTRNQKKVIHDVRIAVKVLVGTIRVLAFVTLNVVRGVRGWVVLYSRIRHHTVQFYNWIRKKGIQIALAVVEPFSHLPGFLGGDTFRKMKDTLQQQYNSIGAGETQKYHNRLARESARGTLKPSRLQDYQMGREQLRERRQHQHHHITVEIDGKPLRTHVKKHDVRSKRRTTAQRGGRHAGTVLD